MLLGLTQHLRKITLTIMNDNGAAVTSNLVKGRFEHFSTENVDISEATLVG